MFWSQYLPVCLHPQEMHALECGGLCFLVWKSILWVGKIKIITPSDLLCYIASINLTSKHIPDQTNAQQNYCKYSCSSKELLKHIFLRWRINIIFTINMVNTNSFGKKSTSDKPKIGTVNTEATIVYRS